MKTIENATPGSNSQVLAEKLEQEGLTPERKSQILRYCRFHPKAKIDEIAAHIGKAVPTVNRYLKSMDTDRSLMRRWVVNLDEMGWKYVYRVDIRINPRELNDSTTLKDAGVAWNTGNPQEMLAHSLMDQFAETEDQKVAPDAIIDDITILLGDPADLCAMVRVKDPRKLYEFVTQKVRCTLGVENTSTCTEAWSAAAERERKRDEAKVAPAQTAGEKGPA